MTDTERQSRNAIVALTDTVVLNRAGHLGARPIPIWAKLADIMIPLKTVTNSYIFYITKIGNWGLDEVDCHLSHKGQCTSKKYFLHV